MARRLEAWHWPKFDLAKIESVLKVLAILAAAAFFGWKLFTGWLLSNMSIALDNSRQNIAGTNDDYLKVGITLTKGNNDTLWLDDIRLLVTNCTDAPKVSLRQEISREQVLIDDAGVERRSRNPGTTITLAPGESVHLATAFRVRKDLPCKIEAWVFGHRPTIRGHRTFWTEDFQWRGVDVALPVEKKAGAP